MKTIAIVGGGISGLCVAEAVDALARARGLSLRPIVLESEKRLGGKIGTLQEDGFTIELGPHAFLDKEPVAMALIDRLGLSSELVRASPEANAKYIVRGGKLRLVPSSPNAFLRSDLLPLLSRLRILAEPFIRRGPRDVDETVWAFARRRLGRFAADVLIDAMVTGIFAGDPNRLSLRAAFPAVFALESQYRSLILGQIALQRAAKRNGAATAKGEFGGPRGTLTSFKRGLRTLIEALELRVSAHLGYCASAVERAPGGFAVRSDDGRTVFADAVVVTTPASPTSRLIRSFDAALADRLSSIRSAPVSVVVLGFREQELQDVARGFGFLCPHAEGRDVLGAIYASNLFGAHTTSGNVMFRMLMGGVRRPDIMSWPDDVMIEKATRELVALTGISESVTPVFSRVIRWPMAIPQYEVGHLGIVAATEAFEHKHPGLYFGGNSLRGISIIQCIKEAHTAAERVVDRIQSAKM